MKKLLSDFESYLLGRQKMDIRQRLLRLVLMGSALTFLVMGGVLLYGMFMVHEILFERGENIGASAAGYTKQFVEQQAKKQLEEVAKAQAELIEQELVHMGKQVTYLSNEMHIILSSPENYPSRILPDPRFQAIHSGEVYIHYGAELQKRGVNEALGREIAKASNIKDALVAIGEDYADYPSSCLVGSKDGYIICLDTVPHGDHMVKMTEDFLASFDPRERPWYRIAKTARVPVFTDVYMGADGYPCITCAFPYYDAQGFAGVASIGSSIDSVYRMVVETSVGESGFSFILNQSGDVVLSAQQEGVLSVGSGEEDRRDLPDQNLAEALRRMASGEQGTAYVTVDGREYYLAFAPMDSLGWSFGTLMSKYVVEIPAQSAHGEILKKMVGFTSLLDHLFLKMLAWLSVLLLLLLVSLFFLSAKVSGRFVRPIHALSDGVREIASGNLSKKLDIHTGDEIEHLAVCFNAMSDELQAFMDNLSRVTEEKEHIAAELAVAANIQESMLPKDFPEGENFGIYAHMNAAKEVGGDFYDFYLLQERYLFFTIADVSGKGVAAALFMVISKTVLKNFALRINGPEELSALAACTNQELCQENDAMMFVTAFMGLLDLETGRLVYVNAGHNPPLLYRKETGMFSFLPVEKNCVLGAMEGVDFLQQETVFHPGDLLFLYTDGVTEALNEKEELYTEKRLLECLNRTDPQRLSLKELLKILRSSLDEYVGTAKQSDDITMMALNWEGRKK